MSNPKSEFGRVVAVVGIGCRCVGRLRPVLARSGRYERPPVPPAELLVKVEIAGRAHPRGDWVRLSSTQPSSKGSPGLAGARTGCTRGALGQGNGDRAGAFADHVALGGAATVHGACGNPRAQLVPATTGLVVDVDAVALHDILGVERQGGKRLESGVERFLVHLV